MAEAFGRNLMLTNSNLVGSVAPANTRTSTDESVPVVFVWMEELEASLLGSHRALLALDLAGMEQRTREQADLIGKFNAIRRQSGDAAPGLPAHTPGWEKEFQRSRRRILEAVRLQAALLARAQSKLRVLANMMAGPSIDYGQLLAQKGTGLWDWK